MLTVVYRPSEFDEVFGNSGIVESLKANFKRDPVDMRRSFLFTGRPGCGKTTLARVIKNELDIPDIEYREYNSANDRGVQAMRDMIELAMYKPSGNSKFKMFTLDECHQMTKDALNAILKLIEEPPEHVIVVLCTSEFDSMGSAELQRAIKRRCKHYQVEPLNNDDMTELVEAVLESEEKEIDISVLKEIRRAADGSPGQALSYLDMVLEVKDPKAAIELINETIFSQDVVGDICRLLLDNRITDKRQRLAKLLRSFKGSPEQARQAILGYFNVVLLNRLAKNEKVGVIADYMTNFSQPFYNGPVALLTMACCMCLEAEETPF